MNSKILLLSIAVISVGLFAMPSTLSLFSGQHTFVTGDNVACEKCHADIYSEIGGTLNQVHKTTNLTGCQGCHKTNSSSFNATLIPSNGTGNYSTWAGTNVTTNRNAHAAVTLECVACHTGVVAEITGSDEAHKAFYYASNYSDNQSVIQLKGANTACIGCHTHTRVNLTWVRLTDFNVTSNATSGSWNVTISNDWKNSTNTTYTNKSY